MRCLEISVLMTAIGGIFKPSSVGNCISLVRDSKFLCVISIDRDKISLSLKPGDSKCILQVPLCLQY